MNIGADLDAATQSFDAETGQGVLRFSGDELFFKGHFPEGPVLPAVVQVAAAVHFAGRCLGHEVTLSQVTRAKFMNLAGPGTDLAVSLKLHPAEEGRTRVKAVIKDGDKDVAELSLRVA